MMLHISSVIVHVTHAKWSSINDYIKTLAGATICASDNSQGKLVIVLEADSLRKTEAMIDTLKAIEGVVSATMVYHHCEPASDLNQPLYEQAL